HHELVHQGPHYSQVIVHSFQEHALVAQRYTVVDETFKSRLHLGRQLTRVIDVNAHPERMKFLEHPAQLRGDPLRQEDRYSCANTDELDMLDGAQTPQNPAKLIVREDERVSAG